MMIGASFLRDIINNRFLLWDLTKKDLKQKYLGSYLGVFWAFIQPTITVLIFWFVFQVGFKSMPIDNFPFILWLVCGMIPWFFFNDALLNGTGSIIENSYLVKKIVFKVSLLPLMKILASLLVHIFFILLIVILFLLYGYLPSIYNLQVIYYLFGAFCLSLGLCWITSALVVFLRDIGQFVTMCLQFLFWGTPIFWNLKQIPEEFVFFIKINPVYYITEGYRNSFIYHTWFWQEPVLTVYFWLFTLAVMLTGTVLFKKLRPHFADVI